MSESTREYKPSVQLCRLYRKTSAKGTTYFTGRLGGARVSLLKSKETADDGSEIWHLLVQEAPPKEEQQQKRAYDPAEGR